MSWYIYILFCDKKTYYVGLTHNIEERFKSHKRKENIAMKEFVELILVYTEKYSTRQLAVKREKQLKGWTVAKKVALINGDKKLLINLSKNHEHVEGN